MSSDIKFISAGAGSGKTYHLTKVLHHELKEGVNPAGVIAMTFTRKAAAELRERVRSHLLKENETKLANAIGQARIGTVNGVCGELLQRFAFEAGLSPKLQVLEELQSALLYQQSIEAAISDSRIGAILQLMTRLGIDDWRDNVKLIANLARANGIAPEALNGFAQENVNALLAMFPTAATTDIEIAVLQEINQLMPKVEAAVAANTTQKNTQDWLNELEDFRQKLQQKRLAWSEWAKISKKDAPAKLRDASAPLLAVLKGFESHPLLHDDIRSYIETIFDIASTALIEFEERKLSLGAIDFIDQERKLLDILDLPVVKEALAGEIELLLVDEFQDTSPIQLALFAKLSGLAQRTYWVGDTKQAIYGFRGSDARLMEAILTNLEQTGNKPETLDSSWRSRPGLVALANEIFTKAFANTLPAERVTLKPKREEYSDEPAFQSWALAGGNKAERAHALAAGVKDLMASAYKVADSVTGQSRAVTYSDIAILARMNDSVLDMAKALTQSGIPTETAQPGLLAKPEAVLAIACLRRLADESDTLATAEIVSLTSGDEPEVWLAHRLNYVTNHDGNEWNRWLESGEDASPIIQRLAVLRPLCQVLTVKEALELVIAECHADASVLTWSVDHAKARMRLANLQALITMAEAYEESCRGSGRVAAISGFVLWLKEQEKAGQDNLAEAGTNSVRVLTYHACKGLEWPVTICTELNADIRDNLWGASAQPQGEIDVTEPLKDRFIRFWPKPYGKQKKVDLYDRASQAPFAEKFRSEAIEESKRLLYVGLTRARDLLILASSIERSGNLSSGEWIEALDCPQLLAQGETKEIAFESAISIPCVCKQYTLDETIDATPLTKASPNLYWFASKPLVQRLPLVANPSAAEPVPCYVAEIVGIGKPIETKGNPNLGQLGLSIHGCIAAAVCDRANLNPVLVRDMLEANGVEGFLDSSVLIEQISAFFDWCEVRYGKVSMLAEYPIEMVKDNGQWVVGQIDLLIDTPSGWILIDHKASMKTEDSFPDLVTSYSGQLEMYCAAVEAATSRKVIERWLYLPVSGKSIQVSTS